MKIRSGFTLIELMVVLVILGILAAFVAPNILDAPDKARVTKAKNDIKAIETALRMYKVDSGIYPTTEQGIRALLIKPDTDPVPRAWGPNSYLDVTEVPVDPWGTQFIYRSPTDIETRDYEIISYGADAKEGGTGTNADIFSYELK